MSSYFCDYLKGEQMSLSDFAKKADLNVRSLEKYLAGHSFNKSQLWFALKVADAMGVDPHILLQFDDRNGV